VGQRHRNRPGLADHRCRNDVGLVWRRGNRDCNRLVRPLLGSCGFLVGERFAGLRAEWAQVKPLGGLELLSRNADVGPQRHVQGKAAFSVASVPGSAVWRHFHSISAEHDCRGLVPVLWPVGQFCHRRVFADWFEQEDSQPVPELVTVRAEADPLD
jgi:hypothetical protein